MTNAKKSFVSRAALAALVFFCTAAAANAAPALVSLDEAVTAAARAVEAKVPAGTEIAVYEITSQSRETGEFLCEELFDKFSGGGILVPLARKGAVAAVNTEHEFQLSGLVDDESAVGIGHYLGAKVVVTGTFDRYAAFSQLRVRAVDVRSSAVAATFTARIDNADPVLASVDSNPLTDISEAALALLDSGKDFYAAEKYFEAEKAFNAAIELDSELAEAHFYRGNLYYYQRNPEQAMEKYNEAIRINPFYADAYNNRGKTYIETTGDIGSAIADFSEAIRLDPNCIEAYFNRGFEYYGEGKMDNVIADFSEVIRINPNYFHDAYYWRGQAYLSKNDLDRAIADFSDMKRMKPDSAEAYFFRGIACYNKGDYDRAIADYSETLRIDPDYPNAKEMLDKARYMYRYDKAIADNTEALRINPNDAEAYNNRGKAYYNKGDYDKALADWEAVLRIDPTNTDAKNSIDAHPHRGRGGE